MKKTNPLVLTSLLLLSAWSLPALAQDTATAVPAGPPPPRPRRRREVVPAAAAATPPPPAKKKGGSGPALGSEPGRAAGGRAGDDDVGRAGGGRGAGDRRVEVRRDGVLPGAAALFVGAADDAGPQRRREGKRGDAAPDAAAGAGRELHRLAVHEQHGRPLDRAQLPLRQRPGEGDGADRVVQHHRLGLPAAGVEPGDQRGVPVDDLAGVHQRERAADADRGGVHEPLRRGGALRRRPVRDVPVRAYAHGGRDADLRLRPERLDVRGARKGSAGSWSRSRSTDRRGQLGRRTTRTRSLPAWEPYPGPVPQESTFVAHAHLGRGVQERGHHRGAPTSYVFANDNERAGSYQGARTGRGTGAGITARCSRSRRRGSRRIRSRASGSTGST